MNKSVGIFQTDLSPQFFFFLFIKAGLLQRADGHGHCVFFFFFFEELAQTTALKQIAVNIHKLTPYQVVSVNNIPILKYSQCGVSFMRANGHSKNNVLRLINKNIGFLMQTILCDEDRKKIEKGLRKKYGKVAITPEEFSVSYWRRWLKGQSYV